jgi:SAM-dependent methyltransferase
MERIRITAQNRWREQCVPQERYAPWQPTELLMHSERNRVAATMLKRAKVFPGYDTSCLEIGYGSLGWLGDLIGWGVRESHLSGIEVDPTRARHAQSALPAADLRVGDAADLPWKDNHFQLVIASTVFTSILDQRVRRSIADEASRVLAPGGALLWYDFMYDNPANRHVHKVSRRELRRLFPSLCGEIRSVTLAPPVSRFVTPRSWLVASILSSIPLLRTHLLAVLIKPKDNVPETT